MNNKKLVDLFLDLVKIDSPTGEEEKVAFFITKFLDKRNIKYSRDKTGNIIGFISGIGEPLLLSAHMDTVEPGRNINPIIKGDLIKSDGKTILGADNKDALSVILNLIDILEEKRINHRPIQLVFTVAEEAEFTGVINLDYKKIKAREGFIFDAAKPIGTIITASPYYLRFDIKIIGNSAHASRPEIANNSILVFTQAMRSIKLGKINNKTIANIGIVNAGHVRNTIPGEMSIKGEIRSFENGVVEKISTQIINEFKKSAKKFGSKIEFESILENPGYEFKNNDQIIKYAEIKMKENNIIPILEKYQGCSDANIFNSKGLKILNLGNGSEFAHTVNEKVKISDLEKLSDLVISLVSNKVVK